MLINGVVNIELPSKMKETPKGGPRPLKSEEKSGKNRDQSDTRIKRPLDKKSKIKK